jgi:hypothetical protein
MAMTMVIIITKRLRKVGRKNGRKNRRKNTTMEKTKSRMNLCRRQSRTRETCTERGSWRICEPRRHARRSYARGGSDGAKGSSRTRNC